MDFNIFILELLTTEMVSEVFGVSKATIYDWRMRRGMPYIKLGHKTYFLESSLQNWLNSREIDDDMSQKTTQT